MLKAIKASKDIMNLSDWLDDLSVRFIVNLPPAELSHVPRICFQVEEAHWFYEDFIRPAAAAAGDPLPGLNLKTFCLKLFQHCPILSGYSDAQHVKAYEEFLAYKVRVPVRGAILLDEKLENVVLVKGMKKNAAWSFPRGKINHNEDDLDCAIREVFEETGLHLREAGLVSKDGDKSVRSFDAVMREQNVRLFVFHGVPLDFGFEPQTRGEISKIAWFPLTELPGFKKRKKQQAVEQTGKFYMVAPFLGPLKRWINQQKKVQDPGMESAVETDVNMPEPVSVVDQTEALKNLLGLGTAEPEPPQGGVSLLSLLQGEAPPRQPQQVPQTALSQPQFLLPQPSSVLSQSQQTLLNAFGIQGQGAIGASAVPEAKSLPMPRLSQQSLNLLNVFKGGEPSKPQPSAPVPVKQKSPHQNALLSLLQQPSDQAESQEQTPKALVPEETTSQQSALLALLNPGSASSPAQEAAKQAKPTPKVDVHSATMHSADEDTEEQESEPITEKANEKSAPKANSQPVDALLGLIKEAQSPADISTYQPPLNPNRGQAGAFNGSPKRQAATLPRNVRNKQRAILQPKSRSISQQAKPQQQQQQQQPQPQPQFTILPRPGSSNAEKAAARFLVSNRRPESVEPSTVQKVAAIAEATTSPNDDKREHLLSLFHKQPAEGPSKTSPIRTVPATPRILPERGSSRQSNLPKPQNLLLNKPTATLPVESCPGTPISPLALSRAGTPRQPRFPLNDGAGLALQAFGLPERERTRSRLDSVTLSADLTPTSRKPSTAESKGVLLEFLNEVAKEKK